MPICPKCNAEVKGVTFKAGRKKSYEQRHSQGQQMCSGAIKL